MAKLNKKQEMFCREYLKDLNATQAAIRAGYSEKTAKDIGCENLAKPNIKKRIAELMAERNERTKVDADYVLKRLVEIDQMDVVDILNDDLTIKPIVEWPVCWRRTIQGIDLINLASKEDLEVILKKIKWPDKVKNLELLGRHVNVQAFKDKVEMNVTEGLADRVAKARARAKKKR